MPRVVVDQHGFALGIALDNSVPILEFDGLARDVARRIVGVLDPVLISDVCLVDSDLLISADFAAIANFNMVSPLFF